MTTEKGFATVAAAAADWVTKMSSSSPPAYVEVLIEPQVAGPIYVSSGELERVILEVAAKRTPPVVFTSLQVELLGMGPTSGTRLGVTGAKQ